MVEKEYKLKRVVRNGRGAVVSLPIEWVQEHHIGPGSFVLPVSNEDGSLTLHVAKVKAEIRKTERDNIKNSE